MGTLLSIKEAIKSLIDALHFAFIVPALILVYLTITYCLPTFLNNKWSLSNPDILAWTTICTLFISYMLYTFNYSLVRLLEGYGWENIWLKDLKEIKRKHHIDKMQTLDVNASIQNSNSQINNSAQNEYNVKYPHYDFSNFILPTTFGNIILASELHAKVLYNIDSVNMWPRMYTVLIENEKYNEMVSQQRAMLNTLINFLFVSVIMLIEIILTTIYSNQLLLSGISLIVGILIVLFLYKGCLRAATNWGYCIRVVYDVFRKKLKEKLNIKDFQSYEEEKETWEKVSEFFSCPNNVYSLMKDETNDKFKNLFKYKYDEKSF